MKNYGRYQIVEELGRGSMGVVYKAHDPQIDRILALKVLRSDRITSPAFVDRFFKEAKAVGRLSHPNIVTVYDIGEDHGSIYIAMEFLQGVSLKELLGRERLELSSVIKICSQVADALHYAHAKGIVHRDIKPGNIIVDASEHVKLTDFGIAHIEDPEMASMTQAGEVLGTPAYMSPEQVLGRSVRGSADIFSLGIVLYEMLTGKRPFNGDNLTAIFNAITSDAPELPSRLRKDLPAELSAIVMKCLAKEPGRRFSTAGELSTALARVSCVPAAVGERKSGKRALSKWVMWVVALILGLSLIAFAGYLSYTGYFGKGESAGKSSRPITNASLQVSTVPQKALVFIDGKFQGASPLLLQLEPGKHEVKITHDGYYAWEAQLNLKKDFTVPLKIKLVPAE